MIRQEIIAAGVFPTPNAPFVDAIHGATQMELAALRLCWLARTEHPVRELALGMLQRDALERFALDADQVLTPAQRDVLGLHITGVCRAGAAAWQVVYRERDGVAVLHYDRHDGNGSRCLAISREGASTRPAPAQALPSAREVNMTPLPFEAGLPTDVIKRYNPTLIQNPTAVPVLLADHYQADSLLALTRLIAVVEADGSPVLVPNPLLPVPLARIDGCLDHGTEGALPFLRELTLFPFVDPGIVVVRGTTTYRALTETPAWLCDAGGC